MPVPDQLRLLVASQPDEVAYRLVHPGGSSEDVTFRRWDADANRFARGLLDAGLRPGDLVAGLFTQADALMQIRAYVGIHKAGGVHVPVNAKFSPPEIAGVLAHATPRWLVVSPSLLPLARSLLDGLPAVEAVISTGEAAEDAVAWGTFASDDDADVQVPLDDEAMSDVLYTSGTTGRPKGVVIRHHNALNIELGTPTWSGMGFFHASPLFTTAGLSFVYVPMRLGMTATYMSRFDARTFLELADAGRINMCFLVPAMVEMILAEPDVAERDLSSMYMVTVGSAPIAPATLNRLQELMPQAMVSNAFGMTESGSAHMALPKGELERRPGSVGKPMPPVEVRIVDQDTREEVATGEIGEVLLHNPGQQREYYRDPEATASTWQGGWLVTGDLGRVDEDGYLYIVGRIKDVIIRGGHNVHAADVEAALYEHPAVREAAVVGVPHDVLGEEVVAAVTLHVGAAASGEELREWCRARVAGFAYPRAVVLRAELPRNATGKVLKRVLTEELSGVV